MNLVVIDSSGWETWDFGKRERGPTIPRGLYPVLRIRMETGRPAIVLAHPEAFGGRRLGLIGEDEESLARGKGNLAVANLIREDEESLAATVPAG